MFGSSLLSIASGSRRLRVLPFQPLDFLNCQHRKPTPPPDITKLRKLNSCETLQQEEVPLQAFPAPM